MEKYGVIAFSFGFRKNNDPGLSNRELARVVIRLMNDYPNAVFVLQHEIFNCLNGIFGKYLEKFSFFSVEQHVIPGQYLDSEEVMHQAAEHFNIAYVKSVFVVAQPFLHLHKCLNLAKQAGFEPIVPTKMKISFDRKSEQWWTRSRFQLLRYAIMQKFFNQRGK